MTSDTFHEDPHELDDAHAAPRTEQVRIVGAERACDAAAQAPSGSDLPAVRPTGEEADHAGDADREGGQGPEDWAASTSPLLPHWTEPPTGEIPAVLSRGEEPEEQDPWTSLPEPIWREAQHDWEQEELLAPSLLAGSGDEPPLLADAGIEERQPWSFELGATGGDRTSGDEGVPAQIDPAELETGELFGTWVPAENGVAPGDEVFGDETTVLHPPHQDLPAAPDLPDGTDATEREVLEQGVEDGDAGAGAARRGAADQDVEEEGAGSRAMLASAAPAPPWRLRQRRERADAAAIAADAATVRQGRAGPHARVPGDLARAGTRARRAPPHVAPPAAVQVASGEGVLSQRTGRDIPAAVASGVVIGALTLLAFHFGTVPSLVVVTAVLTAAAVEAYAAFRRSYRPAALLGIVAVAGLVVGTYDRPFTALPVVLVLLVAASVLWHLSGVDRRAEPVRSVAATLFVFCWVGVFGSFAAALLAPSLFPERTGIAYLLGALIAAVAYDVGALGTGAWLGRHPMSRVSPGKTWEGALGGAVAAVVFAVAVVRLVHPWTLGEAAVLGVVVAVVSPIGDLAESLVKRQLGLKDMGRILPGHGGLLDRVDGLLFVLPATYYLVRAFGHG